MEAEAASTAAVDMAAVVSMAAVSAAADIGAGLAERIAVIPAEAFAGTQLLAMVTTAGIAPTAQRIAAPMVVRATR
jgi:hypothetical protein